MFEREKMDRAVERFEASKAELYREDGSKLYSDEEHEEREAALQREGKATMDAIEEEVDRRIAGAEGALLVAEDADPTGALSTSELESANAGGAKEIRLAIQQPL